MFRNLFDFTYQRTVKEALGFYIAYLLLILVSAGILAGLLSVVFVEDDSFEAGYNFGLKVGMVFTVIACLFIGILSVVKKKLHTNFMFVLLSLCSGILAIFGGGILGLIIPTFLTTRQTMVEINEEV